MIKDKSKSADQVGTREIAKAIDGAGVRGWVEIEEFELVGGERVTRRVSRHNTVTNEGLYGLADNILASPTKGKPTHMAVGTGAGSPAANALETELDRIALDSKTRNNAVVTMVATWNPGDATGTVTELGVFDAGAAGNMWMSTDIGAQPIYLSATRGAVITWTLTLS